MAFTVTQFTPQTQIIAHTFRGETYDLTGDLYSWTRRKGLSPSTGSFTLNLVPRKDWAHLLQAMDYIEIRASKNGRKVNGKLPIIMRGFIDSVSMSTQMNGQNGPAEPRITITGRDYTKLLIQWQVLYLFTQNTLNPGANDNTLIRAVNQGTGFGLYANYRIPNSPTSMNNFMNAVFQNMFRPLQQGLKKHNYPSFVEMIPDFTFPEYQVNSGPIASYTGSYLNLLQYVASAPFGELFIREDAKSPVLVGRMAPYKTITGETPRHGAKLASSGNIDAIQSINVERSDNDLYTYFLTWAADGQLLHMTMPTFLPGLSNGVLFEKSTLYGISPLMIDTPWVSVLALGKQNSPSSPVLNLASDLNAWLIATMGDAQLFWNGSITCHGDETLQIGTYRTVPSTKQEFYIAGISDSYDYENNTWSASLNVVRGRDLKGVS